MDYIKLIENKLSNVNNDVLKNFINDLRLYHCILIGGFIRNSLNNSNCRDIDIILYENDYSIIPKLINKYNLKYKRNNFNGYKILFNNFSIDIWYIENHYLFNRGIYNISIENISKTTFINYDSLVYDLQTHYLDIYNYLNCLNNNLIDFVGSKEAINSNYDINLSITKILLLVYKYNFNLSNRVQEYIKEYYSLNKESIFSNMNNRYENHYSKKLTKQEQEFIIKNIEKE